MSRIQSIAVFGSTGSIGQNTLAVATALRSELRIVALSAHRGTAQALAQARQILPRWLVITDQEAARAQDWSSLPPQTELLVGPEHLEELAAHPEIDCVVAAIVGSAGLPSTWGAISAGKRVALANKETLVMAGPLVMELARQTGAALLPVDSEHSAIFQAMQAGRPHEVARLILTASGGPFRNLPLDELARVTVDQALCHPNWSMGKKITIDSATMLNKALEIIEARWLFGVSPAQIEVVVHPQSVIHSLVEFCDGGVMAQLSPPDMKLPIQYALTYPARVPGPAKKMNWQTACQLDFSPVDTRRFPAIELGFEAARAGGTAGAVLNAANEAAVAEFLAGEIPFTEIAAVCRRVLNAHTFESQPTLERLLAVDRWARQEVTARVCS
ncbi:MAG: 1-deoxy-D-xylulose-5-phosphate reductoisomerase [Pirellulales bacterium]|nr:1-deoxy-D-xylulose-5-phosphate reductoisomerase [Pirellulales bacterium]